VVCTPSQGIGPYSRAIVSSPGPSLGQYDRGISDIAGVVRLLTVGGQPAKVPPALLAPLLLADAFGLHDERQPERQRAKPRRRRHTHKIKRQVARLGQWIDGASRGGWGA
jgi:hypothetical protein